MLPQRNPTIDVVKGFLVLDMIVFHVVQFWVATDHWLLPYLDFVTGGFAFFAGFTAAWLAPERQPGMHLALRLWRRGLRLAIFFVVMNVVIDAAIRHDLGSFLGQVGTILWQGDKEHGTFEILLPIAYTLILSGLILPVKDSRARVGLALAPLAAAAAVGLTPEKWYNAHFVVCGLAGVALGSVRPHGAITGMRTIGSFVAPTAVAAYCGIVYMWDKGVVVYVLGIAAIVGSVAAIDARARVMGALRRNLALLGSYSLIAYVGQILFMQALMRLGIVAPLSGAVNAIVVGILAWVLLTAALAVVRLARTRSLVFDKVYRLVMP